MGQPRIEPGPARNPLGQIAAQLDPGGIAHIADCLGQVLEVGRIEHRDQRVVARGKQFGGARFVSRAAGDDQDGAGLSFTFQQNGHRIVRLIAAGADPDVPGIAEQ